MTECTPIDELPSEIRAMAYAYCHGNHERAMAVMLRCYEKRTYEEIAEQTGVAKSTVHDLVQGFRKICTVWAERRSA